MSQEIKDGIEFVLMTMFWFKRSRFFQIESSHDLELISAVDFTIFMSSK
ncbi:hypothetical protein OGM63_03180 [Plectonema radiosum NIES-515]|uniref:Uncharacterized protein n=1 Tax=Plectonema radiosum NIES-515 TaxID=2986073 RepID=A0ABT3AU24_9CYAN|nr:hypothetical protein [Plectonema radiosum NIES-515]